MRVSALINDNVKVFTRYVHGWDVLPTRSILCTLYIIGYFYAQVKGNAGYSGLAPKDGYYIL